MTKLPGGKNLPIGWKCPACGKGNAPSATKCGHCADQFKFPVARHHWEAGLWPCEKR